MIRPLTSDEVGAALKIINEAARAYQGVIPEDCWQEPYMSGDELQAEIAAGVDFWAYQGSRDLLGVMGRQPLTEVTLIRHAYVLPLAQHQGIGARLLNHLLKGINAPVLVGTWAAAWWAIRFYKKYGFRQVAPEEKDRLLRRYWTISERQVETSVVLADGKWFASQSAPARRLIPKTQKGKPRTLSRFSNRKRPSWLLPYCPARITCGGRFDLEPLYAKWYSRRRQAFRAASSR